MVDDGDVAVGDDAQPGSVVGDGDTAGQFAELDELTGLRVLDVDDRGIGVIDQAGIGQTRVERLERLGRRLGVLG